LLGCGRAKISNGSNFHSFGYFWINKSALMPIASTYFIKSQIPDTTMDQLLKMYEREILIQGAGQTAIRGNVVEFSGSTPLFNRYENKFAGFSEGRLIIEETETEFEVFLEAESPKWIIFFDIYFTKLRNDLEMELQSDH